MVAQMQANAELNKIALLIQQNQWQAAEKMLQALLRKSPQHAVAHRLLGDCLLARQQWRPALEVYQRSLSLRMSAEALIGMGYCHIDAKQFASAQSKFRTALALSPRNKDALRGVAGQEGPLAAIERWREEHRGAD